MRAILGSVLLASVAITALAADVIQYTADKKFVPPQGYREWIYLASGLDMSYTAGGGAPADHSTFTNVFLDPDAYRAFMATGKFPDKAVFAMEVRGAETEGSINKGGRYQTGVHGMEYHVKDGGQWSFYASNGKEPAKRIPQAMNCYSCHADNGAVDTVFVQFYPTLMEVAKAKGTLIVGKKVEAPNVTPSAGPKRSEPVLRKVLSDLERGQPDYTMMTPDVAEQTKAGLRQYLQETVVKLGPLKRLDFMTSMDPPQPMIYDGKPQQIDQFQATYEHGWIQWRVFVTPEGKLARLIPANINAPGVN
jgi:hypothetical protein